MKKIVVLTGSPRRNGNSSRLADSFIKAAEGQGCEVQRFDTAFLKVAGCMASICSSVSSLRVMVFVPLVFEVFLASGAC